MIKNLKPQKKSRYKQGYYPIEECKKFVGKPPVIYRSNLERLFCDYCERSIQIKSWDSECIEIIYFDTKSEKQHRYYPDFLIKMEDGLVLLIEVKPSSFVKAPKEPKKQTKKSVNNYQKAYETYRINMLKFAAAVKYCADRGWVFRIITEEFFKK